MLPLLFGARSRRWQRHASGINLQIARHIVIVHPYCSPAAGPRAMPSVGEMRAYERQAVGRVRRFPQRREVVLYRLFAPGTVEEELYSGRALSN